MTKDHPFWNISGFLTLLAAYALAAALPLASFPIDLYLCGAIGLYFCSRWRLKGCSYALMLLSFAGLGGHIFLETHHFLRLALEASLACSFIAITLSFETQEEGLSGLESQLASRALCVQNLEEEIGKIRELQVEAQLSSTQKIDELQKNYEEIATEKYSLEVLNDVLRKANAAEFNAKTALENQALVDKERFEQLRGELTRFKEIDLASVDQSEMEDLQKKEAALQIQALENEHRLVAAEERLEKEQCRFNSFQKELEDLQSEKAALQIQASIDKGSLGVMQRDLEQLQEELTRFKEMDHSSTSRSKEIEDLKMDRSEILERLAAAEEKVEILARVEAQHRQLKAQFEEKGRILHETRSQLFKAETDLQTLSIEKEEQNVLPDRLQGEFDRLELEIAALQGENQQLQELVTQLSERQPTAFAAHRTPLPAGQPSLEETLRESLIPKRKKKAKKPVQQDLLF